ncbi:metallophosphoesterase family protein [Henriciella litoralis]|uniref:metallophosphoesterase family protein n=1 Tax=Henriciella litoralis TaxID=568102 RepID=UPI000A01A0AD|nr:metallophosphoesterase family protein [Henriciella litoralis]
MDQGGTVTYVIGDVHGEAVRLARLHQLIFSHHSQGFEGRPIEIVHLGDYVDRGPDSAGVIEQVMELEQRRDVSVISLAGNHEEMLLKAVCSGSAAIYQHWLENGGQETLSSYQRHGEPSVPDRHLTWLKALPRIHVDEATRHVFVHAGIHPAEFPDENDSTYLWTRSSRFFDVEEWRGTAVEGWTVIHGHTPTRDGFPEDEAAEGLGRRINIDTGAVYGGRLTCAVLAPGRKVRFLFS